jgi:hypothetical protein
MTQQSQVLATRLPAEQRHEADRGERPRRAFDSQWQPGCQEGGVA